MENLFFSEEVEVENQVDPWRVLIVDDDETVHNITKSVLKKTRNRWSRFEVL